MGQWGVVERLVGPFRPHVGSARRRTVPALRLVAPPQCGHAGCAASVAPSASVSACRMARRSAPKIIRSISSTVAVGSSAPSTETLHCISGPLS